MHRHRRAVHVQLAHLWSSGWVQQFAERIRVQDTWP